MRYAYVIVGGGPAGASAVEGIRAHDRDGAVLLVTGENHPPYRRPPLSKGLWLGGDTLDGLPIHAPSFYRDHGVELALRREIVELDPEKRTVWDDRGVAVEYGRLLLATGSRPRPLGVEGALAEGVRYFRSLEDYLALRGRLDRLQHALVVGGGFLGVELAAALRHAGKEVTWLFPRDHPLERLLPRDLGMFVAERCRERGVETVSNEAVAAFEERSGLIVARTHQGNSITTQLVIVGAGVRPQVDLAEAAGLAVGDGVEVDEYGRTSGPDVYAAGDVAEFPCVPLGVRMRVEHWDHAVRHGRAVGANMAGAGEPYACLPVFSSEFFDLRWEAVGDPDPSLETEAVWKEPLREGVVFYLRDDAIRGVLLWNVPGRLEWASGLVRDGRPLTAEERTVTVGR